MKPLSPPPFCACNWALWRRFFLTHNMVLVGCASLGVPYEWFGHTWSLHVFVKISMHIVLIFSMGGVLLVLSYTFLFPYTRVYGLCRGGCSDLLVFMSLL